MTGRFPATRVFNVFARVDGVLRIINLKFAGF
jgi:hypothetical protein